MEEREEAAKEISEAFSALSDETRLAVIRALGEAGDAGTYQTVPFSTLQERVGVEDNGRFGYHLNRLVGRFVDRTDEGYRLRIPGIQVYQAIQAGAYADHDDVGPLETDVPCHCGGGPLVCRYEDFRVDLGCPDCGCTVVNYPVYPESFGNDLPGDVLRAADRRLKRDTFSMELGCCPYCAGTVVSDSRGRQSASARGQRSTSSVASRRACTRCHWFIDFRAYAVALIAPSVAGSFAEAGIDTFEVPQWSSRYDWNETLSSEDPVRVRLRMTIDGVTRVVTFDRDLDVLEVRRSE